MGRASVNTGTSGRFTLDVYETFTSLDGNFSDITWTLFLEEASSAGSAWNNNGISATVGHHNVAEWWSGDFTFDWRPGGLQFTQIASGQERVYHNPDGTGQITVGATMGNTGSQSAGGPTSITNTIALTTLKKVPNTPTGLRAERVNDGRVNLTWAQNNPSNGAASGNDIDVRINDGAFGNGVTISAANSTSRGVSANQKLQYRVRAHNSAGWSAWSGTSPAIYTTPGSPTAVTALKNAAQNIVVKFTSRVAYSEHSHEVWHGVSVNGVVTWDAAPLDTIGSGVTSYTHVAPNPSQIHVYRVRARGGGLTSAYATTSGVQLLIAPNKPTTPTRSAYADAAQALVFGWQHNPADTSPQTAYEFQYSQSGGSVWSSTGKVVSEASAFAINAGLYAPNTTLTMRVRTWGAATTGGSDSTGASPWSDLVLVTFKTAPTATILVPATGSIVTTSTLRANIGFAQPQGATFVAAKLQLMQDDVLLEELDTSLQVGIRFQTPIENTKTYTMRARVQDSNDIWSPWVSSTFTVEFLAPVPADVTIEYLTEEGFAQLNMLIAEPGTGQARARTLTITRTIDGVEEIVVEDYPATAEMSFLDTTPVINGTNHYRITTESSLGAQSLVEMDLVTTECRRAFLSKGPGFSEVGAFGGNLSVDESLNVASSSIQAAGRTKPIGLYGVETSVQLKVQSFIFENFGSSVDELRKLLLVPGNACYRDASGRRVFGAVKGSVDYSKVTRADLSFTLTESGSPYSVIPAPIPATGPGLSPQELMVTPDYFFIVPLED